MLDQCQYDLTRVVIEFLFFECLKLKLEFKMQICANIVTPKGAAVRQVERIHHHLIMRARFAIYSHSHAANRI